MRQIVKIREDERVQSLAWNDSGGQFNVGLNEEGVGIDLAYDFAHVIASNGGGWDHVSVSFTDRTPTWDEMCQIRDLFFDEEDCVLQYHPPKSVYKNVHEHCLHLWRSQTGIVSMPPMEMV